MLKASSPVHFASRLVPLIGLAALAACNSDPDDPLLSLPEPRVATLSGSSWDIEPRPDDSFSTWNSIFATGEDGRPVALRQVGTELRFGRWTGTDWETEVVRSASTNTFPADDEGDQLYSGVMVIDGEGNPHAMFVNVNSDFYYVGRRGAGEGADWTITPLTNKLQKCYDLAVGADGIPRLLFADIGTDSTYVATVSSQGDLETTLVREEMVCGTVDATIDSTSGEARVGVLVWALSSDTTTRVAKLYERKESDTAWSISDVVTNGRNECYYCYVPQFAYRGDGVPVAMFVDSSLSPYVATRLSDGSFSRKQMALGGQTFQLTSFKEGDDGSLAAAIIVDSTNLGLVLTRPGDTTAPSLSLRASAVEANTPRLAWTGTEAYLSFWSAEGLSCLLPEAGGTFAVSLVDSNAGYGHVAGGVISISSEGQLQVFYNESHELED